ncbi:MAG: hypothetical protein J7639_24255 [Paenibacillaceae bacterium]|nr:hypothetical protein [Paenibacillaceae bacterium]
MSETIRGYAAKLPAIQESLQVLEHDCLSHTIANELAFRWMPDIVEKWGKLELERNDLLDALDFVTDEYDELLKQFILLTSREGADGSGEANSGV